MPSGRRRAWRACSAIIPHYAKTHGIDVIVAGTHGHQGIRRFVTDEESADHRRPS
ncbi:MAG: hypothetical protein IIC18_05155 [Bacteroidetes bacterium]|nr:hypothetical protein [Bacteroidota bacterium]MCH8030295.1 hypothetical protein [Bacteroidota bacterium]